MEKPEIELPDTYEMCCGKRRCPKVARNGDGVVITDVDRPGELDEFLSRIEFNADQARELRRWLEQKGF